MWGGKKSCRLTGRPRYVGVCDSRIPWLDFLYGSCGSPFSVARDRKVAAFMTQCPASHHATQCRWFMDKGASTAGLEGREIMIDGH
eukprot:scaffold212538_cov36-Tisochrysis_lutea.AAC.2